ncbi:MAG: WD40 repeat domain-containing protein [Pirellulales bacterium]
MRATLFGWLILGVLCVDRLAAEPPPPPEHELVLQMPPSTGVGSVAVSPDGALVATGAGEGGVRLYDALSGRFLRCLGNDAGDRGVCFSPDGRTLTAAGFHMDKLVGLFDVQSGKRVLTLPGHTEWEAYATALSPDGKLLASTGTDRQILVWELPSGKLRLQLATPDFVVSALAFSPDSATLASGGGDKQIHLWDAASGQLRRSLTGHRAWIAQLEFSPDGQTLLSGACDWASHRAHDWPRPAGSGPEQSEWRLWDVASGNLLRAVPREGRLLAVAFSPDGRSIACGVDKEVRLYERAAESPGKVVATHDAGVTDLAFTPDGAALLTTSHDQTVKRTNLATGKTEWTAPGYFEQVNSVALSDDGDLLVTGSSDLRFVRQKIAAGAHEISAGAVRVWDARRGRLLRRLGDPSEQVMAVAISPDRTRLASGAATATGGGAVNVWDEQSGKLLWSTKEHGQEVLAVAFAPRGDTLAAGDAAGNVVVREAASGRVLHTLAGHAGGATSLVYAPDGATLFCGAAHGGAKAWDVASGQLRYACQPSNSAAAAFRGDRLLTSLGLSRDGQTLAVGPSSVNNEYVEPVRLWNAATGKLVRDFTPEEIHGRPMALSPDGKLLATGGKWVKLWDTSTGKLVRELYGHLKRTQSIVFSSDGRLLVAGGSYGSTNLWDVASGQHLATLQTFADGAGNSADVWAAFQADGTYAGSEDVERFLAWRVGEELLTPQDLRKEFHSPERVEAALASGAERTGPASP